ncbi:phage terminase large subunit [Achromobacter mucicolens]|uniref:Phage terminase large subunit n=1 Tax=Achromobacter mucicolens TaxID=1389922 RepID=A0ABD4YSD1_9BURK|nr:phage terminase large subunit [Achromobacter mucicolens]MDH1177940.1 phage terminase large subunit [Achromobacter mucicolens]
MTSPTKSYLPSRQEAARELLIRRRARADILQYANAIDVPGRPVDEEDPDTEFFEPIETTMAVHHRLLLTKLEETSQRRHGRMIVCMPPGSAKSTYASVVFPSKYLGATPGRRVILASYGDDLARKMGRRTRSIIKQPRYRNIWGAALVSDSNAAQEFALSNGSEYMACGILSGITGNRAHGIIIDDPIKGREQANSDTIRNKTWDAYEDDLKTRLIPGGWIVLITTRWHEDDLAGRILPEDWKGESGLIRCKDGNDWEVLCIQARCEVDSDPLGRARGEYLWPEWFDRQHWAQFESNSRTWSSLYQQLPTPLDGDLFKPDQIQVIDALPAGRIDWVRGWDFASTDGAGDFTAGPKLGRLPTGQYVIGDMVRGQWGPDRRDKALENTAALDGRQVRISIPQDPGQAGKTQVLYLTRGMPGYRIVSSPESGDKVVRAEPFAAQVNVGNVLMVRGDWNKALIDELRTFPNGKHDDQVDGLSRAFADLISAKRGFFG